MSQRDLQDSDALNDEANENYEYIRKQISPGFSNLSKDEIKEAEQDTQVRWLENLDTIENRYRRTWFHRVAHNGHIDIFRKRDRSEKAKEKAKQELESSAKPTEGPAASADPAEQYEKKERREFAEKIVPAAIESLPEKDRTIVEHLREGKTLKEIAEIMDMSRGNVYTTWYRIKSKLKNIILRKATPEEIEANVRCFLPLPFWMQDIMRPIVNGLRNSGLISKPLALWIGPQFIAVLVSLIILYWGGIEQSTTPQLPYSFDAPKSATMFGILETPVVERPPLKSPQINQAKRLSGGESENGNQEDDSVQGTAADSQNDIESNKGSWTPTKGPYGGVITALHATPEGVLFAGTLIGGVFRSADNGETWKPTSEGLPGRAIRTLTQMGDILYARTDNNFFYSTNGGDSWQQLAGLNVSGIAIIGATIYIGQQGQKKVSFSNDNGESWTPFNSGLTDQGEPSLFAVGTTLFAQMRHHVFRCKAGEHSWTKLAIKDPRKKDSVESDITKFVVSDETVYAVTADGWLFRSTDMGDSWESIKQDFDGALAVMGNTVFYIDDGRMFLLTDAGNSWKILDINFPNQPLLSIAISSEKTFYVGTGNGIFRSTSGGKSWVKATTGIPHTDEKFLVVNNGLSTIRGSDSVKPFVSFRNALYTLTGEGIVKSANGGNSWVPVNDGLIANDGAKLVGSEGLHLWAGAELTVSGGKLYAATCESNNSRLNPGTSGIYYLAEDENSWLPVHPNMPSFNINRIDRLAVSGETFYVVAATQVYRWRVGEDLWTNLGLQVLDEEGLKGLAVSGRTVYVATYVDVAIREEESLRLRKGKLLRSVDEGDTWTDVSQRLPNWDLQSKQNYEQDGYDLHFVGETIYAGSDYRVLRSIGDDKTRHYDGFYYIFRSTDGGETWTPIIVDGLPGGYIDMQLVDGTTLYGTSSHGIFRLAHGSDSWEKLALMPPVSKPPVVGASAITSLAFDGTAFYANTWKAGIFRLSLEE